jgi:DNA ligase-1
MSSDAVYDLIEQVAATSSKNEKIALLEANRDNELLKRVLNYAYNPFKTYGIRKRPETIGSNVGHEFDEGTWELLDDLIERTLTGNAAIEAVQGEMTALSASSAELLWRIITKDMRAGFSESTCNKVWKGLIPDFPYMRCSLPKDAKLNEFDWTLGVISQEKADGMFANLDFEEGGIVSIRSRQGSPFPMEAFELLVNEVKARLADGMQYHGELLVQRDGKVLPREIGNGILNSILSGGSFAANERPIYMIWDAIPLSSVVTKGKYEVAYIKRLSFINRRLKMTEGQYVAMIETRVYHSLGDAYSHYRDLLKLGKEGTIIKNPHAIWKDGTSKEQVKLKLEFEVELEVYGFEEGNGKNADTFGALKCKSSCGQLLVSVSGFTDAKRREIHENRDDWGSGAIITVRANSIMRPSESSEFHSLFLPRFVERRFDKSAADDLARIEEQQQAAMEAA